MFLQYTNVFYQFTRTKQEAPHDSDTDTSLQICGSSVWNLL